MKGGVFAATPELLDELEEVLKKGTADTLKYIKQVRSEITKQNAA